MTKYTIIHKISKGEKLKADKQKRGCLFRSKWSKCPLKIFMEGFIF